MLIDIVASGLDVSAGGPSRTIVQLSNALAACDCLDVRLVSQSHENKVAAASRPASRVRFCCGLSWNSLSLNLGIPGTLEMRKALANELSSIVHINGVWHPMNHWVSLLTYRKQIPLIVQPRGMLEPWALGWHSTKKRLALSMYQRRDLKSAALLVATAEQEASNLRRFGLSQPIAVIPNGVDLEGGKSLAFTRSVVPKKVRRALFLSRIHPKKGLFNLLKAWVSIKPIGWILQIAGPDEGNHLREVLRLAQGLGISQEVEYIGEFNDKDKWTAYRSVDLFVLPTFSENFGVVVAEALSQGLPVVTTTATPWQDLHTYKCGWWVDPNQVDLARALSNAFSMPDAALIEMGERGRAYVQRYDWGVIANQMLDTYRWLLGKIPMPACVWLD